MKKHDKDKDNGGTNSNSSRTPPPERPSPPAVERPVKFSTFFLLVSVLFRELEIDGVIEKLGSGRSREKEDKQVFCGISFWFL